MTLAPPSSLTRLDQCVAAHAQTSPAAEAWVDGNVRLTYRDADRLITEYAKGLAAAGIGRGDRVAVLGHSRLECLTTLMALSRVGAMYVGLNPKYTLRELTHVVEDASPVMLFGMLTADEQQASLQHLAGSLGSNRIVVREAADSPFTNLPEFLATGESTTEDELNRLQSDVDADAPAAIVYTSGSTGAPKGALLSHYALLKNTAIEVERWWKLVPRCVTDWPINHIAWVQETNLAVMLAGGTLFFRERFDPEETIRLIDSEQLNSLIGVGSMLKKIVSAPAFEQASLTSLERILFAVDVTPALLETLETKTGATLATSLGMTETVGAFTFSDDDADRETLCTTVGRPDPRFAVELVDATGAAVAPGDPGEITVRADSLFSGYLNRPEATAEVLDGDGRFHTGDIGILGDDGNLRMVGRKRDMFKSGGYNVYPAEVEAVLAEHSEVTGAAVVAVADELWNEVGLAYVSCAAEHASSLEPALRRHCRGHLANYKIPKHFVFVRELPALSNGKVDKASIRQEVKRLGWEPKT